MRQINGSRTGCFIHGLGGFSTGLSGRELRRYLERRLKKLDLQRIDLLREITPTSRFC